MTAITETAPSQQRFTPDVEGPPLRGELFSIEHLRTHAAHLAESLRPVERVVSDRRFQRRFQSNAEFLKTAYSAISTAIDAGDPITTDAEWLLDNFYVVEEQLREIRDDLPAGYFRELPKLANGEPRIYQLAMELLIHTDSAVDHDTVTVFVCEFQKSAPLSIGEVWALPIMLRLALVENLRRLAAQMLAIRRARSVAERLLREWRSGEPLPLPIADPDAADTQLVVQAFGVVGELYADDTARGAALEQLLTEQFPASPELIREEHRRQAGNQVSIGNVITSMRLISALDWVTFFEQTSLAEQVLRRDPAGVYAEMDLETRDRYRHEVEDLAKQSKRSDIVVAERAIAFAQAARTSETAPHYRSHVGYWLMDAGRSALERELNYRPRIRVRVDRWLRAHPYLTYQGAICAAVLLGLVVLGLVAWTATTSWIATVVIVCAALVPVGEFAVCLVNLLVMRRLRPWLLPKLELKAGVPAQLRTIVVIPSMLSSHKDVASLLERLELHYVANVEPELCFALLTDFADAPTEHRPDDEALVEQAVAGIRSLNARYGVEGRRPFYLFHRARRWNECEQVWMGWERKRGKLMEFNHLLHGEQQTTYVVQEGDLSALRGDKSGSDDGRHAFPFVITLDADTQLTLGAARRLIGTLAHPLNRAQLDPGGRRVIHGYTILQPRVSVQLADGNRSRFSQIFANSKGLDPYATAASDVYQDLFGEGSFTGKGIYDLAAFEQTLDGAFAENQILSHDLIEGCHARVALVSDIEVIDAYPARYDAEARRQHRWVRGDWQILPWLFHRVPCRTGQRANCLSALSRWKIFDNLRRSLVPPATCAFLILGWFLAPSAAGWWSLAALVCIGFPTVSGIITALLGLPRAGNWRSYATNMRRDLARSVWQTLVIAACLPHRAYLMVDAVARTLVRMCWTRRRLLEWETAAATECRLATSRWSTLQHMWFVPVAAVVIAVLIPERAWAAAVPWLMAWFVSPAIADWISRPLASRRGDLTPENKQWLRVIARNTWSFFETWVGPQTHWLPPDNLQEYPQEKLAERISPTNEGLFLVSALAARDFGYLGLHALIDLWERNLESWCQLPQLRGHFYNWYDTATLQPLMPRYVSTVDSGNLAASLIVVRQGIDEVRHAPVLGAAVWTGLQDTLEVAAASCDDLQPRGAHIVSPPLDNLTSAIRDLQKGLSQAPTNCREWVAVIEKLRTARLAISKELGEFLASHRHPTEAVEAKVHSLFLWIDAIDVDFRRLFPWAELLVAADDAFRGASPPARDEGWQRLCDQLETARSLVQLIALPEATAEAIMARAGASTSNPGLSVSKPGLSEGPASRSIDASHRESRPSESPGLFGDSIGKLAAAVRASSHAAVQLNARYEALAQQAEQLALGMDFRFLFDPQRRLFAIGYNLEDGRLDRAHYDMLCSEARISSHLAIAKGDVAPKHWFQLARPVTYTAGQTGLLSWGGTMFEFLMPLLFQRQFDGSLLAEACSAAVARQREYGRQCGTPWGVSESAFAALAVNSDYHYQSFGVPGLGLKRGLSEDRVVAPYASMLALSVDPTAAVANLRWLEKSEAIGRWGFYDAVDFTSVRVPAGRRSLPVRCYMAHHQAMSLLAMANALHDQIIERRFHAHPLVRATELLLQESLATGAPLIQPHADETAEVRILRPEDAMVSRRLVGHETPIPRTHLLSNGTYSVMVTNTGGGYSQCGDIAVSRWRPDTTRDHWGQFVYLRDSRTGRVWSPTYQPTCAEPDSYEVLFSIDKAEYRRIDGELETHLEVAVSPEHNVELRQLKITNLGSQPHTVELTSYVEIALATQAADLAHPAFQKLFVETEYVPEEAALIARRRPRSAEQAPVWALHVLSCTDACGEDVQYESSRQQFLGRGRDPRSPAAMDRGSRLSGSTGLVLDPIFSLRCTITIAPQAAAHVAFATGVAKSREDALRLADEFHDLRGVQRGFELAWAFNQVKLHHLHLTAARAQRFQQLASFLLFPHASARGPERAIRSNHLGQSGLWRHGISGDRPILLAKVSEPEQIEFVRELLMAHEYWDNHGLRTDLVFLNMHPGSYLDALQEQLQRAVQEAPRKVSETKNAIFVLRGSQITEADHTLLEATAHVVLSAHRGWSGLPLQAPVSRPAAQSAKDSEPRAAPARQVSKRSVSEREAPVASGSVRASSLVPSNMPKLEFWNGTGGFADDGREYRIWLPRGATTPMPWSNIIANPRLGCLVTETGGGYTWSANSREGKLTTWANDPVTDSPAEMVFLRDERTHEVWTPLASPRRTSDDCWVHHGQGYTRFLGSSRGLRHELLIAVAVDDPVKFVCLTLRNDGASERRLSATYFAELVLGVCREQTQMHIVTEIDKSTGALLARNAYHPDFPLQVCFLHVLGANRSCTADRNEFLGRNGDHWRPAGLQRDKLSGRAGAGLDPCGAVQSQFILGAGQETEIVFLLGYGDDAEETQTLLARYGTPESVRDAVQQSIAHWDAMLSKVQVRTPDRALDLLVNRWLVYQTLSCRLWGRSAYYQSGGAYGFRDQLQDVMALVYCRPDLVREHLLRAAARQYEAGDVQHWWHPPHGKGTRTRFSDDLLWLPFAVARYVYVTGDDSVLDESVSYLHSPPLQPEEHERYETPQVSLETSSLYEHCLRTLARGFHLGEHGLPLMGCGDWNDGMNLVGVQGRGESVWVGWFLLVLLDEFLPLMDRRGDAAHADQYREQAGALRAALEQHAWDGEWYRRAYFDDGTPLGSRQNDECQIDSIVQSWAVMADADPARTDQALDAVFDRLVFPADRLVALFTPPFDQTALDPGYIKGYLPGVRENGGQYTHAVLWLIHALTLKGDGERAAEVFDLINPILHTNTPQAMRRYQVEPYVMAADVYSVRPHTGRGGWTWYTGSASWTYRVAVESILGLNLQNGAVRFHPCVPRDWEKFEVSIRVGRTTWRFIVKVANLEEGESGVVAELVDDGRDHEVEVSIGRAEEDRRQRALTVTTA